MKTIVSLLAILSTATAYAPNPAINVAAKGMSLLKPLFKAEAEIQAAALGALSNVDKDSIIQEIIDNKTQNKVLIYTYGLSPFSSEAVKILEGTGYEFAEIELGKEWFLLGGKASVTRVALSEQAEDGATSLPKIFIGGECIGGCSALSDLAESGELEILMNKAKVPKVGELEKKGLFSLFN